MLAEIGALQVAQVLAFDPHRTRLRVIESLHQLDDRALARP